LHPKLIHWGCNLTNLAKEVKSNKEKVGLALEKEALLELLKPLMKLNLPYGVTSLADSSSIKRLYASNEMIIRCLTRQYFRDEEEVSDVLKKKYHYPTISEFHDASEPTADFDQVSSVLRPILSATQKLVAAIELAQLHLNDLEALLDPDNNQVNKAIEIPEAFAKIKNFRLYQRDDSTILSTRSGTRILEFQSIQEAEEWERQYVLRNSQAKITKAPPVPKRKKNTVRTANSAIKRTFSNLCDACNGTGLWGNCRSCGGKGFF
jgi:hypothetical protein